MTSVRPPAVDGRFYPRDAGELGRLLDELLAAVEVPPDDPPAPAYVVPHAGYRYSGPTAAQVYARLHRYGGTVSRVVVLGPAHYVPVDGCAVPTTAQWLTPLGGVDIDGAGARALVTEGHAVADDRPFTPEHSIEVQVPFLQRVLPAGVPLLPVLVGRSTVDVAASAVMAAISAGDPATTVVLCSTDLSHYLDDAAAREQDSRTAQAVLDLAPERITAHDACGAFALRGTLDWARSRALSPRLLHLCTSADTAGDPTRVVGYSAFALTLPPSADESTRVG